MEKNTVISKMLILICTLIEWPWDHCAICTDRNDSVFKH